MQNVKARRHVFLFPHPIILWYSDDYCNTIIPDIIGLTEVKPKNAKNIINLQEYHLDLVGDYNMCQANIDNNVERGLVVHKTLKSTEVTMETQFQANNFGKVW